MNSTSTSKLNNEKIAFPYKLRVKEEDFEVTEVLNSDFMQQVSTEADTNHPPFGFYLLQKSNFTTPDALRLIIKKLKIATQAVNVAGNKDRHAITQQFVTIKGHKALALETPNFKLTWQGWSGLPLTSNCIDHNQFKITLRGLKPHTKKYWNKNLAEITTFGLPNYYDDQRFGSYDSRQGFVGEHLLRREWQQALKVYLTLWRPSANASTKKAIASMARHWGDWKHPDIVGCHNVLPHHQRQILQLLSFKPTAFVEALQLIPQDELSIILSAYQSYLWNLALTDWIQANVGTSCITYQGETMPYLFPIQSSSLLIERLSNTPQLAAIGRDCSAESKDYYRNLIAKHKLSVSIENLTNFDEWPFKKNLLQVYLRPIWLKPVELKLVQYTADELNRDRHKAIFSWKLPRGSFATMVVKRLSLITQD